MVFNIGGIVNLLLFIFGQLVGGYDIGFGNMLMDVWIWCQVGKFYDKDVEWVWVGKVIFLLL